MARGDDDSSNRTRGRRKSPFPPLRLVQDLPDSDDAAPRSPSGAGKSSGGARVAKPHPSVQAGRSAHPSQGSVRAGAANGSKRAGHGATNGRQAASGQARRPHPAKGGLGQGSAASRNAQGRPVQKNSSQKPAGQKAAGSKSTAQNGSTQNGLSRGAQRSAGRGGHGQAQAHSGQGRSSQARSGQARSVQGRSGQASNAQRSQGQSGASAAQARSGQGRTGQPRTSQGRSGQGRNGQGSSAQTRNASRTGAASAARRGAAGAQRQNPRKQAQGAPGKRRVNAPGARPSRPQSQAPERRRPPVTRPKKPPRQPMDPALKASLMRLGRNVFLVVLTVVLVVWGFNYVTETVRVQNLQAARQNQGSGMPTPLACDTKNLDVTITLPAQVARGQALTVNLKVANKANIPCIFDVGSEHLQMRVTSGTDTVYDAATCKVEPNSRKMLLAPLTAKAAGESAYVSANPTPDSFTTSVSWNGQRYKADCSSAGPSQAGTYVLRLNLDGKELVGQQVFIVK